VFGLSRARARGASSQQPTVFCAYGSPRPFLERTRAKAMTEELPFRVVRSNSHDETLARCTNLIAQAAYRAAARMYATS